MSAMVQVGECTASTEAMGPGRRACLWVRGCSICCPGCATPEFIPLSTTHGVSVEEIGAWIARARTEQQITGVSFSGGEPFEQAVALAAIARYARTIGCSVLSWSGYTRAHLEGSSAPPGSAELLATLDALIDGPFIAAQQGGAPPLRGSTNQVLHLLTDRHRSEDFCVRTVEIRTDAQDHPIAVGVDRYARQHAILRLLGQSIR
ncbi:radical SAM protein [Candidatus Uhrbacteria bacterium]|nr:radical SAM protein [Candidatus Uhrbacteria bacterium]